jgi:DnaJ-class molecular chaperone
MKFLKRAFGLATKPRVMLYESLNLPSRNASTQEIEAAYHRLKKIFDPDNNGGTPMTQEFLHELEVAYMTLTNPSKRKIYDEYLERHEEMVKEWEK